MDSQRLPSSFRDPSGFIFEADGQIFRHVTRLYQEDFDQLMASGLYGQLVERNMLVSHQEMSDIDHPASRGAYKLLSPQRIPFISYPYEWCFSQLKDAALLTLSTQKLALEHAMVIKDASAFNIQFFRGKPILIDTLSFQRYQEGQPWVAYKQFCQHFLAPLSLMSMCDMRLSRLSELFIDGIPLDLTGSLLPWTGWLNPGIGVNIMMHSRAQNDWSNKSIERSNMKMTRSALNGVLTMLRNAVESLKSPSKPSHWSQYYNEGGSYSAQAFAEKERLVSEFIDLAGPSTIWDLGSNTGNFSRICASKGVNTIAFDADALSVELNYAVCKEKNLSGILPLVLDLTAPTPAIGWSNKERLSITERGPADTALALALIHHLAIANNLPFSSIADFFKQICSTLVIEFVPKSDPQSQRMLSSRQDIFADYTLENFEQAFSAAFDIKRREAIEGSQRVLYLMAKKPQAG